MILTNTSKEWENSNEAQDLLADKVLRAFGVEDITEDRYKRYYKANKDALKTFQERKTKGLNLSQRVWNLSDSYKDELEMAISAGVESGMSANSLATQIKKYLNNPDKLFRRVRDKFGNLVLSKNAKLFHPGQGVYRSSYRNAQRLAISEINMAYRQAENIRWQQLDFVVGYEIKLSTNHNCKGIPLGHFYDICDDLKGKYPKDFVWSGWHPMCYSDDSEILTNKGWKLFSDVDIDDLILSLNPNNRNVEWVEIIDRQCYGYKGDMYHFYNQSLDCLVTPEHQMIYINKADGGIKRCEARDYRKGKGGFYRGCVYDAEDIVDITIGDTSVPFDLFCEFMGYWLSDGSTIRKSQIVIAQRDGDPNKDNIIDCIERMGFKVHSNTDKVEFYCTDLCQYLKGFGLCTDKYVPNEIKQASKRQIRIFLDAYNSCDGSKRTPKPFINDRGKLFTPQNEEIIYFTTSEQMAADLGELILKVGKRPSYFLNKCAGREVEFKNGIYTINHDCYRIAECKAVTATVFKKQIEKYDGYVYDLTLERNHIMYIRRNGKCFWGSNCRCYKVPILKTEEEFWSWDGRDEAPTDSVNKVEKMPDKFLEWQRKNADKIARAEQRGTLPYFLRDNKDFLKEQTGLSVIANKNNSAVALEKAFGIKQGKPMTFEEANELRGNPHYSEDVQYTVNCQSAVVANEMRRRGYDVEAYGNGKTTNYTPYALSMRTEAAWQDVHGNIPSPRIIKRMEKSHERYIDKNGYVRNKIVLESNKEFAASVYDAMSEEGRYHISWEWKKKKSGHIITAERLSDGNIRFYDPQTGQITQINLKNIDLGKGFKILRVDNLDFNIDVVRGVVKKSGTAGAAPLMDDLQKAFWKKNGMDGVVTDKGVKFFDFKKNVRASSKFHVSEEQKMPNLETGILRRSGISRKNFIDHCFNEKEISVAEYIWNNPNKLSFYKESKLGEVKDMTNEKAIKNINRKQGRGVVKYNEYTFNYNGDIWHVKLEVLKGGREQFYSMVKKK